MRVTTPPLRIVTLSLLLFVLAQFSTLLHASEHYFHSADDHCSIYSATEHNKPIITYATPLFINDHSNFTPVAHSTTRMPAVWRIIHPARAPPSL